MTIKRNTALMAAVTAGVAGAMLVATLPVKEVPGVMVAGTSMVMLP
jgi:hypothetical protein